ncbi:peroxide stress protein YaaA [Chitinasiproducens palmae]|uniref:UPF0246 protein SAMN05216551_11026 n=1 Tax=Chitinasiproducens palmae TaxID=1770053 RepID=A0A1H2PSJ2_9BURK|nr:peroxide stress protein YaaA [Chitinasiproducens palmae]SDV49983.1 hypothetical protein SAMN05216551_11026 [Chitinasiproducens palmae]
MIIVLSPAKSLDYETPVPHKAHTQPDFIDESARLIERLRAFSPAQIATLMHISDPLAHLNFERFAAWSPTFDEHNARAAVYAFNGDVYEGLAAQTMRKADLDYAQKHLRILSGLYGVLRPLDLMQPYRLEMGTRLDNERGRDLYAFWGERIAQALNAAAQAQRGKSRVLVNLASQEYFKSVVRKALDMDVVTPVFEDFKGGRYKIISFYAKRARGLMARYAIDHRIERAEQLQQFDVDGYRYDAEASSATDWVFRRKQA